MTLDKYGMALPLTSTIRIVRIFQVLIVPNPVGYRRNLPLALNQPSLEAA
jgi:hypothetical protein